MWSVVIWAAVTPDLEEALRQDIKEAWTALRGNNVHVHVFQQTSTGVIPLPPWPPDSGEGAVDVRSLSDAFQIPCWGDADHRMLVLWGHGEDSLPPPYDPIRHGRTTVPSASQVTQVFLDSPPLPALPDIVGYDACWMASVSTFVELGRLAVGATGPYLVASMVPEPASGWPYFDAVRLLEDPVWGDSPKSVSSGLVEAYAAAMDVDDWCLIALDLAKAPALERLLADFATGSPASPEAFYQAAQGAKIEHDSRHVDLGALLRRLDAVTPDSGGGFSKVPGAEQARTALLDATIVKRSAGRLGDRDGLSAHVELPPDPLPDPWDWTFAEYLPVL